MEQGVIVSKFEVVDQPDNKKTGRTVLGRFSCEANGFLFDGCILSRVRDGGVTVHLPHWQGYRTAPIRFGDQSIRTEMRDKAREAYAAAKTHKIEGGA